MILKDMCVPLFNKTVIIITSGKGRDNLLCRKTVILVGKRGWKLRKRVLPAVELQIEQGKETKTKGYG